MSWRMSLFAVLAVLVAAVWEEDGSSEEKSD